LGAARCASKDLLFLHDRRSLTPGFCKNPRKSPPDLAQTRMNRKRDLQLTSNQDDTGQAPMQLVEPQVLTQTTNLGMTAPGRLGLDEVLQLD
jgi:hypothetical protein